MKYSTQKVGAFGAALVTMGRYVNLVAPVCIAVTAIIVWTSFGQVSALISTGAKTAEGVITKNHPPRVNRINLDAAGYADVIRIVAQNNPAVRVQLGDNKQSMMVFVTDAAQMPEWMFLLSTLQSYRPGLIWSADSICMKKCPDNRGAMATLQAYTQEIVVN
jgi:hypothetical protein